MFPNKKQRLMKGSNKSSPSKALIGVDDESTQKSTEYTPPHITKLPLLCLWKIFKGNELAWAHTCRYFFDVAKMNKVSSMCKSKTLSPLILTECLERSYLNPQVPYKSVYCAKRTESGTFDLVYTLPEKIRPRSAMLKAPNATAPDLIDYGDGVSLVCKRFDVAGIVIFQTRSSIVFAFTNCLGESLLLLPFVKRLDNRIVVIDRKTYQVKTKKYTTFFDGSFNTNVGPYVLCNNGTVALAESIFEKTSPFYYYDYKKNTFDNTSVYAECIYLGGEDVESFEILAIDINNIFSDGYIEYSEKNVSGPTKLYDFF